jgi:hypothetical protein
MTTIPNDLPVAYGDFLMLNAIPIWVNESDGILETIFSSANKGLSGWEYSQRGVQ